MPIRQVFESDPGTYRVGLRYGWYEDAWYNSATDRQRLYDEYASEIDGLTVIENPESPSDYKIAAFIRTTERSSGTLGGLNTVVFLWSGRTGEFLGHDARYDRFIYGHWDMTSGAKGVLVSYPRGGITNPQIHCKFVPEEMDFVDFHPKNYYVGAPYPLLYGGEYLTPCVDEDADRAIYLGSGTYHASGEVAVYQESTGLFLYKFDLGGIGAHIFMADSPYAYVVTTQGTLVLLDYVEGKVLNVLHAGISQYPRKWTWDRYAKRILSIEFTPDILPNGDCTLRVKGLYPAPAAVAITNPIPLQAPAQGRRVEWVTRVYGGAGEGIPGVVVNYALDNPAGATVSPAQHTTDHNGNSRTFVTCTLAGDNELTATAEV